MVMLVIPVRMRLMENTMGMGHLVSSQVSVSQICCAHILVIQMVYQQYDFSAGPRYQPV